jgi:hypothetical protein
MILEAAGKAASYGAMALLCTIAQQPGRSSRLLLSPGCPCSQGCSFLPLDVNTLKATFVIN